MVLGLSHLIWSEPVPKLSSPQREIQPASIKLPKNFHPVGVSKHFWCFARATLSSAPAVGILRAKPLTPVRLKYGIHSRLFANTASESFGVTKKASWPRIMLRSCQNNTSIRTEISSTTTSYV